ncbi:MAG TPA: PilN domain-containing protein [Steroidobacteraceae bacterium]|nr:PilN domain-containing protein [Steroidobacteraceae bacterium]
MPRINLLPWREAERRERKLHFTLALGAATLAAVALTFVAYLTMDSMVSAQQRRNNVLRAQIKILDKEIEEINSLENDKQRFIARMDIIEKLQRSRPEIVHLFDTIVRTLPDGVYLTSIKESGMHIKFEGIAQSSTRVSSFMRNIDSSEWLKNPALEVVESKKGDGLGSSFVLDAEQVSHAGSIDDPGKPTGPLRRVARREDTR